MYDIVFLGESLADFTRIGISSGCISAADSQLRPEMLDQDMLRNTRLFHTGSSFLAQELGRSATYEAIDIAKDTGAIISYAPNYCASLWQTPAEARLFMRSLIITADIMKISGEELPLLTGETDPAKAADALLDQGVRVVVITLGAKGVYVRVGKESLNVPGFQAATDDLTDAEDCFFGAFLARLLSSERALKEIGIDDAADYVRFGNAATQLCVEQHGIRPVMPDINEILDRMQQ